MVGFTNTNVLSNDVFHLPSDATCRWRVDVMLENQEVIQGEDWSFSTRTTTTTDLTMSMILNYKEDIVEEYGLVHFCRLILDVVERDQECSNMLIGEEIQQGMKDDIVEQYGIYVYCVERVPISSKIDSECDGIVATTSSTTTLDPNLQTQLNLAEYIVAEFGAAEFCRRLLTFGALEVAQGHKHCSSLLPPEEIQQGMKDSIVEQFGLYVYCVERVPILSVLDAECDGVVATTSTTTIMDPNLQILL